MKIFYLVLPILLASVFELGFSRNVCPPHILIHPCTCDEGLGVPFLACVNISDMQTLEEVFERSGDRTFQSFNLFYSTIMYLPAKDISEKKVEIITILNSTLLSMFDAPPAPDNKLRTITLGNVVFERGVDWEIFGPMKNLASFIAGNMEIKSLEKPFVDNIGDGLEMMIFSNTKTRKIQHNAFAKMRNLAYLTINNGDVRSLQRSMFAKPSALEELDFSGNQITDLSEDVFSDMPSLRRVDFSGNKIKVVSEAIFGDKVRQSSEIMGWINLDGNPLKCDCSMYWYVTGEKKGIQGTCASPLDQKGKVVQYMSEKDLDYCG